MILFTGNNYADTHNAILSLEELKTDLGNITEEDIENLQMILIENLKLVDVLKNL